MPQRTNITRAAIDAGVEIGGTSPGYAGVEATASDEDSPPEVGLYVPPVRKPPIVIARYSELAMMLEQGSVADFAADAELIGVMVDPGARVDSDFLSRLGEASHTDVVVTLRGEEL